MAGYQATNHYSYPYSSNSSPAVSIMDADATNTDLEAMKKSPEATSRATLSLHRGHVSTPSPVGGEFRRKPVGTNRSGSRRSRLSVRTRLNSRGGGGGGGEMEIPLWGNPEPIAVETPTGPDTPAQNELTGQSFHVDHALRAENIGESNLRNPANLGDWSETPYPFPTNGYGEDIGNCNIDILYNSSSATVLKDVGIIATICAAHFLTQAGLAQSVAPIPYIANSFTTATHVPSPSWYSAAYSLTVGTFILPAGRLGDVYGLKLIFVLGWLWFAMSSLSVGFNPRILESVGQEPQMSGETFFCFCRALQGIGPALLMPNGLGILGRTYEGNQKNMAFALFGASAPVGFVVGSVMSSLLAEKTHWSWAYWAQAIACAIMGVVSIIIIPSFPESGIPESQQGNTTEDTGTKEESMWKRLDIPGAILGVSGLVLINIALNQAPLVSWSTPYTYFILIIGIIILSLFFFVEFTPSLASHPLIPVSLLSVDTCFVLACISCGWGTFGIWIFYLWEFLESLRTLSPLQASAQFAPAALSGLIAAVTTGFLLSKTTPQVIMLLSMCAFFTGITLIATVPVDQIYWAQTFFSIIVMPWGMDMSFPSATILLSNKVRVEHQGVAMSLVNTIVNYSISVGLGLAGTVQSNVDRDGTNILTGYRSAWYFGMGLSGTGILVAVFFLVFTIFTTRAISRQKEQIGEP
jgi:MFS family permease